MKLKKFLSLNEEPELLNNIITDDMITLMTKKGSVCQLSRLDILKKTIKKDFKINLDLPIFFFNRLKAKEEGQGEGSFLMKNLIKILDEKKINVVNTLNPYGKLNMQQLEKFYEKFEFKKIGPGLMIREFKK